MVLGLRLRNFPDLNRIGAPVEDTRYQHILASEFSGLLLVVQVIPDVVRLVSQDKPFTVLRKHLTGKGSDVGRLLILALRNGRRKRGSLKSLSLDTTHEEGCTEYEQKRNG